MLSSIRRRTILAFLIAPISVGFLAFLASFFMGSSNEGLWVLMFSAIIGYSTAIVAGIPTYILFRWKKWTGLVPFLLASVFFSSLIFFGVIIAPRLGSPDFNASDLMTPTPLAQIGLLTVIVTISVVTFWLIDRPDRYKQDAE